jgi:hypothetical protein
MVTARPVRTLEDALLLGLIILIASPAALVGGIVGGRMLREGGAFEQRVLAALIGGILSMPLSCVAIWQIGW